MVFQIYLIKIFKKILIFKKIFGYCYETQNGFAREKIKKDPLNFQKLEQGVNFC